MNTNSNSSSKKYSKEFLDTIHAKTDGRCHICHKKLSRKNYGQNGSRGAWHVEHSKAKANGGTDHMNNLFPACIPCNIEKGTKSARSVRAKKGTNGIPLLASKKKQVQKRKEGNTFTGAVAGGLIGLRFGGPVGALAGAVIGGVIGSLD